ncbi:MAG: CRISPR-associated endonuclease Cas6 [Candidatus Neomarinimicrobiota bacterium]|nr:CRISPR-associated endonuclease Cas6 [Candidatus Neomarinimicrobiota bacterium]
MSENKAVAACLITDKPVKKTPYQVKGVFMKNFSSYNVVPMLNGEFRNRYLYPRVQVKVINEKIFIIGIGNGYDPVLQLTDNINQLDFGNITFDILEKRIDENENIFDYKEDPINYQFITSWAALNKNSLKTFRKMNPENRINYLNKLLEKNIAFISNELNLDPPEKLISMIKINSTEPMLIDNRKWGSFDGKFKTNFHLPSFVGLGNGITRGFGTLFNENYCKTFNREFLGLNESDENKYFESDCDEIYPDDFKKLNTIKNKRNHRSAKQHKSKHIKKEKYTDNQNNDNEPNFNTELYHQKQHKV